MGQHNPYLARKVWGYVLLLGLAAVVVPVAAQTPLRVDWRRIGNSSIADGLASPSGGATERVWFEADGATLLVQTAAGRTFATADFETWREPSGPVAVPAREAVEATGKPEPTATLRALRRRSATVYGFGAHVWRSDNEGGAWTNLTRWKQGSLLGGVVRDLAISPSDERHIAVASTTGVWTSRDGGQSWVGLNDNLPSLQVQRVLSAPAGSRGIRVLADGANGPMELEWFPGQRQGWIAVGGSTWLDMENRKRSLSALTGAEIVTASPAGEIEYAGDAMGRLWSSSDRGRTWRTFDTTGQRAERIWTAASDARVALALVTGEQGVRVYRTVNGGAAWDDLTSNLPRVTGFSVTADRASGAVYIGTANGVYFSIQDLRAPASPAAWTQLAGAIPAGGVRDVRLDDGGNQLFAAIEGYGVYAALAPHRLTVPAVVHAADYLQRPAAPGALLSVLGLSLRGAGAGALTVPVLSVQPGESQIQVPFEITGQRVALTLDSARGPLRIDVPLGITSPAILVDRDASPMLLDGDSGVQVDAMNPARAGSRIQVLATGLGKVTPDWPTGMAAPLDSSPRVIAPVKAYLDGVEVEVLRAILAPGYIGYYLVELQLPDFVNTGAGELAIEAGGRPSNRVRVYVDR